MLFTMANVGLPGTSGFVGEFLTLMGVFQVNTWVGVLAATGVILSAGYALWLYRRVVLGDLIKESLKSITDMDRREKAIFAPLVVMTLLLGVYPSLITDVIGPSVEALLTRYAWRWRLTSRTASSPRTEEPDMLGRSAVILPEIVLSLYAMGGASGGGLHLQGRAGARADMGHGAASGDHGLLDRADRAGTRVAFGGMFVDDAFARFAKVTILWSAAAVLLISQDYMTRNNLLRFEYPVLIALAVVGMMVMVSAGDLIALYMGLELQSLALYVVASLRRDSVKSTEAGLKYFILGALSSGLLLFGASLVYGFAGTTQFTGIIEAAQGGELSIGLLFGLVFDQRGAGLQGLRRAVPHVDAGCLRRLAHADHGAFRHRAQGGRHGAVCARRA
jgi:NADH:ubiquinone oxidoreductase subunit 2 (subunit N)